MSTKAKPTSASDFITPPIPEAVPEPGYDKA